MTFTRGTERPKEQKEPRAERSAPVWASLRRRTSGSARPSEPTLQRTLRSVEAAARGLDVDKPRNLAKSVTVE